MTKNLGTLPAGTAVRVVLKGKPNPITGVVVGPYALDPMPSTVIDTGRGSFPTIAIGHHTVASVEVLDTEGWAECDGLISLAEFMARKVARNGQ